MSQKFYIFTVQVEFVAVMSWQKENMVSEQNTFYMYINSHK